MVSRIEEPLERLAQVLAWSTLSSASKVLKRKPFDRGEEREAVGEVCFSKTIELLRFGNTRADEFASNTPRSDRAVRIVLAGLISTETPQV